MGSSILSEGCKHLDSQDGALQCYYYPLNRLPASRLLLPRSGLEVCWACSAAWRWKSSAQPDGGEGLAKCKGYRREAVSEGSIEQTRESMDKNRIQGASVGRAGLLPRSPYPSRMQSVDSATMRGRRLSLPQEICPVSLWRLRMPRGILTAGQKSAEGVLGDVVGKATEALHAERRSQQIGRAGNGH